jgi:hypothetical protein
VRDNYAEGHDNYYSMQNNRVPGNNSAIENISGASPIAQARRGADSACQFGGKAVSFQEPRMIDHIIDNALHKKKSHLLFREQAQSIIDKKDSRLIETEARTKPSNEAIKVYSGDFDQSFQPVKKEQKLAESHMIATDIQKQRH